MTNISFVLTFAVTALIIYRNNLVKMIIGQELLSVGLNIFLISAGITISDANILSATLFLWIIAAVDVAVGLPLVMAITISKRLGANKLSCVNNLRAISRIYGQDFWLQRLIKWH